MDTLLLMCKLHLLSVLFKIMELNNLIILFIISGLNINYILKQIK